MNFSTIDMILLFGIVLIGWWMMFQSPMFGLDSLSVDRARAATDDSLSMLRTVANRKVGGDDSILDKKDMAFNAAVTSADEATDVAEQKIQSQIDELENQVRRLDNLRESVDSVDSGELAELKTELVEMINVFTDISSQISNSTIAVQGQLMGVENILNEVTLEVESTSELAENAASVVGLA
jgi:hypothetical protein